MGQGGHKEGTQVFQLRTPLPYKAASGATLAEGEEGGAGTPSTFLSVTDSGGA